MRQTVRQRQQASRTTARKHQATLLPRVLVFGRGNVGRTLHAALRRAAVPCSIQSYRAGIPKSIARYQVVWICTRDAQIQEVVTALLQQELHEGTIIAHVAGAHGPEALSELRSKGASLAQAHPYCSILSGVNRSLDNVPFVLNGDKRAVSLLRHLLKSIGARPVTVSHIDCARYHLSAAFLANGAVALLARAEHLLADAGIPKSAQRSLLLSLLDSVRNNVARLGPARALTGPVRRGDDKTIARHLELLRTSKSDLRLYQALLTAQLAIVPQNGELSPKQRRSLKRLLRDA